MTNEYAPIYKPTTEDATRAKQWLTNRFGPHGFSETDVESLSWMIAQQRYEGAKEAKSR